MENKEILRTGFIGSMKVLEIFFRVLKVFLIGLLMVLSIFSILVGRK